MAKSIDMPEFVQMVRDNFSDADINTIVEIGALDANDSIYFKEQFPHARVVAFEAFKENYEKYMLELVTIECYNLALFNFDGHIDFHIKNTNGIHSIFDRGQEYGQRVENVKCARLDSVIDYPIDMMKIDVEGATYEVLEGMGSLLDDVKIMHIETENAEFFKGQKLHNSTAEFLTARGFSMIKKTNAPILPTKTQHDSVWIKK